MNGVKYLKVALNLPFRRTFDYLPPKNFDLSKLQIGQMVLVPFGTRKLTGVVIDFTNNTEIPLDSLKEVIAVLDNGTQIAEDVINLCKWTANYYHHSIGEVFNCALPALLKAGESTDLHQAKFWLLNENIDVNDLPKVTIKQREIIHIFTQHPDGISEKLINSLRISKNILATMLAKNIIQIEYRTVKPQARPANLLAQTELVLNSEQSNAVDAIISHLDEFKVFLLAGVTGSGKTEIYLQLIRYALQNKLQVLVLIPEINLTPQTLARFSARFNAKIAVIHSSVSDKDKFKAWVNARDGEADIVIGTRSAIFTPLPNLGLIIVDEEHDQSYKQQESLRYNARDLAIVRGKTANIPVVLGSATASLESLHNVQTGKYQLLNLPHRAGGASLPSFAVIDVKGKKLNAGITTELQDAIAQTLANNQQVLVFLNKRGFAQVLLCHDCGHTLECPHCDARLVFHQKRNILRCHHCEYVISKPNKCPNCGSLQLVPVGAGTERAEDMLQQMFKQYPVFRVDRDTTTKKEALTTIFAQVQSGKPCILVGTQMLAKGHHFPMVTLVAILDVDNGLYSTDFRATEKMAQTIMQVAGRAGRAQNVGKVLIQTHLPNHNLLNTLTKNGYLEFARQALEEREQANLPPFSFMALIRSSAIKVQNADEFLEKVTEYAQIEILRLKITDVELSGVLDAPMAYRARRYRKQLLIQSTSRADLHNLLKVLIPTIENLPQAKKVRWSVDVDPIDMY